MTKVDSFHLRKSIPREEFDYLLLKGALSDYAAVRQKINELLKSGIIIRVKKGLYAFAPEYNNAPVCKEVLANLIYGPSCISLEYALAYHGMIPERVETLTCVTPKRDKEFTTPLGKFTYTYLSPRKYPHGIEQVWIDSNHPVLMASAEKALCDYMVLNKVPDMTDTDAAKDFLESDLRIEKDNWKRFDPNILWKLNRFYRNKNIEHVMEVL
jgi:predicted transcriptional regulator of viral defense system